MGPTIDRANSSGDIWTPWEFIRAVQEKFGLIDWDLAASLRSSRAYYPGMYIGEVRDSLGVDWHELEKNAPDGDGRPLLWLNPPYSNITVWAKKCAAEFKLGAQILLLTPASIGANWYWDHVEPYAEVYSVGRMVFDNCYDKKGQLVRTPYPKDLILSHYSPERALTSYYPRPIKRWLWKSS